MTEMIGNEFWRMIEAMDQSQLHWSVAALTGRREQQDVYYAL